MVFLLAHFISKAVRFHQKMTELLVDSLLEFLECAIHSVLYVRGIYPAELFERRMYLGVAVWQSRHPEINNYIHRIMKNLKPLIQKDAVDRVVVATLSDSGTPVDHISFKCKAMLSKKSFHDASDDEMQWYDPSRSDTDTATAMSTIQEELRSCILKVGLLDTQLPKLPDDCTWSVMVITTKDCTQQPEGEAAMQSALTSGEWYVDNNQITEQLGLAQKVNEASSHNGSSTSSRTSMQPIDTNSADFSATSNSRNPKLVPIKSFQNELLNLSVYAHVFPGR